MSNVGDKELGHKQVEAETPAEPERSPESEWQERLELMAVAIDVAEKLDDLERKIDPHGEPPRHAALAQQRLRTITRNSGKV